METYYGFVETLADAVKLFDACLAGRLPRVRRRLKTDEMRLIRSGSILVWIEEEAGFNDWTDGKSWVRLKTPGIFTCHREDTSEANGFIKKLFSIYTIHHQRLHLVSYYQPVPLELQRPSTDSRLKHVTHLRNIYQALEVLEHNDRSLPPLLERGPVRRSPIDDLSFSRYFIDMDFTNGDFERAWQLLTRVIETLNNLKYQEVDQTAWNEIANEIAPGFQRLNIIQLCYFNKQGHPSLSLQYEFESRLNASLHNANSSNNQPKGFMDAIILDAIRYIRASNIGQLIDSRLSPKIVIPERQKQICTSVDRCYETYLSRGLLSAETEMKLHTAKICILASHFNDESIYDLFKNSFNNVVKLASSTMKTHPDVPFGFRTRCLPLLEFVILKCRHLEIRYQAWEIVRRLAEDREQLVDCRDLIRVGRRIIEKEHSVEIKDINRDDARLFPTPPEEMRVRDYTSDNRFKDLVKVPGVDAHTPAAVRIPYNQQLLLRCGSSELDDLAGWFQRRYFSL